MRDTQQEISRDVLAVGRVAVVPLLLQALCETTGLGFAVVARVTDGNWTACAVLDLIGYGMKVGDQLKVETTLSSEVRASREPIFVDHASKDPRYSSHPTPRRYGYESYVGAPIVLGSGEHFGCLCALDPRPMRVSCAKHSSLVTGFAKIIAEQLDLEMRRDQFTHTPKGAVAAADLRETVVAILGHDLRKPLRSIAANAAALEKRDWDPASGDAIGRIKANVESMSTLIDDMMDFARGRLTGGIHVRVQTFDGLERLFADAVSDALVVHPGRTVISNVTVGRPVCCDPARLKQLVGNLLENALSHAPGPVSLIVDAGGNELVIEVWNDGKPIPKQRLAKIFTPFWQDKARKRQREEGEPDESRQDERRLGLHICSLIVAAHRGKLTATSSKDLGTQFVARIPLVAG